MVASVAKSGRAADAIPAVEFESRPLTAIRSLSEVFRHVAFWNQYVADTLNGKQADHIANELPPARYSTKSSHPGSADVHLCGCDQGAAGASGVNRSEDNGTNDDVRSAYVGA